MNGGNPIAAPAAEEPAERLIADGRAEAEAEVKALIKATYKASLLRAATEQLEGFQSEETAPPSPRTRGQRGTANDADQPLESRTSRTNADSRIARFASDELRSPLSPALSPAYRGEGGADSADEKGSITQALGCYVYAITPAGPHDWLATERGVDPRCPLELVTHEDVQAIVSAVTMDEFGQAALASA